MSDVDEHGFSTPSHDAGSVSNTEPLEPIKEEIVNLRPIDEIAKEAAEGKWGQGQDRRMRLAEAGYDPNEIQREVVRLANS